MSIGEFHEAQKCRSADFGLVNPQSRVNIKNNNLSCPKCSHVPKEHLSIVADFFKNKLCMKKISSNKIRVTFIKADEFIIIVANCYHS